MTDDRGRMTDDGRWKMEIEGEGINKVTELTHFK